MIWSVVLIQHVANYILVDLDAERINNLPRNSDATELGIAGLQLNDGGYQFWGRPLWAGLTSIAYGRKEQTIFAINQGLVEFE
ncbi:MAG: hypothetical protein O3C28_14195 [Proteobacteria bacterium]|nr:hypothetical protein [Pseudomonadota bacterium]